MASHVEEGLPMRVRIKVGDHVQHHTGVYLGKVLAVYNTAIRHTADNREGHALALREDVRKCKKPR